MPLRSRQGPRGEELVVPFSRKKFGLLIGICLVFMPLLVLALVEDPGDPWAWTGIGLFGVVPGFLLWRMGRRGMLSGQPAMVLSDEGLVDNQNRIKLSWDEVERIVPTEFHVRGATITILGIYPTDPAVAERQMGELRSKLAGVAGEALGEAQAPLNLHLQFVSVSLDEVVAGIRRFWKGPIDGYGADFDREFAARKPQSRLYRFVVWWVAPLVVGAAVFLGFIILFVRFS